MRLKKIILSICEDIKRSTRIWKIHLRKNEQMVIYPSVKKQKKYLIGNLKLTLKKVFQKR